MSAPNNKTMGFIEWLLLILLAIIWGGSFFLIKVILSELQPFTIVLGRVSIAAIVLNLVVRLSGYRMPSNLKTWRTFLLMGLLNNLIPFSLITWGQTQISSSLASILNATTPVWTVLLAHFLTVDERLTKNRFGGVIFGLIGVVFMIGWDAVGGLGINILAQLDKPWLYPLPGMKVGGALLGLALLSTALAYIIYFRLLTTSGATNLLLVTFLVPVSAILLGTIILGEQLLQRHVFGMIMVGLSLAAIDGRLLILLRRNKT